MKRWVSVAALWKDQYNKSESCIQLPRFKKRGLLVTYARTFSRKEGVRLQDYRPLRLRKPVTRECFRGLRTKPGSSPSRVLEHRLELTASRGECCRRGGAETASSLESHRIRYMIDNNYNVLLQVFREELASSQSRVGLWLRMMRVSAEELFTNMYDFMQAVLGGEKWQLRFKIVRVVFESCLALTRRALAGEESELVQSLVRKMQARFPEIEAVNMLQGIGVQNLLLFMGDLREAFSKDIYMRKLMSEFREVFSEEQTQQLIILYFREDLPALTAEILKSGIIVSEIQFFLLKSKLYFELPLLGFNYQLLINVLRTLELLKEAFCSHPNDERLRELGLPLVRSLCSRKIALHVQKQQVYYEKGKSAKPRLKCHKLQRFAEDCIETAIIKKSPAALPNVVKQVLGQSWLGSHEFLELALSSIEEELKRRVCDQQIELMVAVSLRKGRYALGLRPNPLPALLPVLQEVYFQMEQHFLKDKGCMDFLNQNPEEKDNLMRKGENSEGGIMLLDLIIQNYFNEQLWFRPETFCVGMLHLQIKKPIVNYWLQALEQVARLDRFRAQQQHLLTLHCEMVPLFLKLVKS